MKKVLWLASWYPSKIRPLDGDFIQRHAHAAAGFSEVNVIFVIKDAKGMVTNDVTIEYAGSPNCVEAIAYYKPVQTGFSPLDRVLSMLKYLKVGRQLIRNYISQHGAPDLVHVNVVLWAGLLAFWLKRKNNIRYVITEHWTGYLPESTPNFSTASALYKYIWRKVVKNAENIITVSAHLGKALQQIEPSVNYTVIPNVVDTRIFYPAVTGDEGFTFIHVSAMNPFKNVELILEAFAQIIDEGYKARLIAVGNRYEHIVQLTNTLHIEKHLSFEGELPQTEVAGLMRSAQCLVLYSRYETFGCVIIEANACGLPVIVSDYPAFNENVIEGFTGVKGKHNDKNDLAAKMKYVIDNHKIFNKSAIAAHTAAQYNYDRIGKMFRDYYDMLLHE